METLKWCRSNGVEWDKEGLTCLVAAEGGHLETLKWCLSDGCTKKKCAVLRQGGGGGGGHLETLQWCRSEGCEWDERTCIAAAEGGALEDVQMVPLQRLRVGLEGVL